MKRNMKLGYVFIALLIFTSACLPETPFPETETPQTQPAPGEPSETPEFELTEIPLVCDRVLVLYDGRIVHEQDAATATEEALLSASHGLERTSI